MSHVARLRFGAERFLVCYMPLAGAGKLFAVAAWLRSCGSCVPLLCEGIYRCCRVHGAQSCENEHLAWHAAFAGTETQRACARRDARVAADNQWRTVYAIDASAGAWIDATAGDRVIEKTGAAFYAIDATAGGRIDATAGDRGHTRRRE